MALGGLLSTQEARVALGDSCASFVLSNLPGASITPWLHAARLPFLNLSSIPLHVSISCTFSLVLYRSLHMP